MSLAKALDDKLSQPDVLPDDDEAGSATIDAASDDLVVEAEVSDCDRLGATVERLKVRDPAGGDVRHQAAAMPRRLRSLGERLLPVEADPELGGAVVRSDPQEMDGGRFWEVSIGDGGREAELERFQVGDEGQRSRQPYTLTREQLGRVVDGLAEGLGAGREEEGEEE